MIKFIKWIIGEYKKHELEQAFEKTHDDSKFMNLFAQCRNYGFDEQQILYIMNLVDAFIGE